MTKLVKVDSTIVVANNFAGKIEDALGKDQELAVRSDTSRDGVLAIDMLTRIDRQLFDRFAEPMPEVAVKAVVNAFDLGVPYGADTRVDECGCIWAVQTTFRSGSGDIILSCCSRHAPFIVGPIPK